MEQNFEGIQREEEQGQQSIFQILKNNQNNFYHIFDKENYQKEKQVQQTNLNNDQDAINKEGDKNTQYQSQNLQKFVVYKKRVQQEEEKQNQNIQKLNNNNNEEQGDQGLKLNKVVFFQDLKLKQEDQIINDQENKQNHQNTRVNVYQEEEQKQPNQNPQNQQQIQQEQNKQIQNIAFQQEEQKIQEKFDCFWGEKQQKINYQLILGQNKTDSQQDWIFTDQYFRNKYLVQKMNFNNNDEQRKNLKSILQKLIDNPVERIQRVLDYKIFQNNQQQQELELIIVKEFIGEKQTDLKSNKDQTVIFFYDLFTNVWKILAEYEDILNKFKINSDEIDLETDLFYSYEELSHDIIFDFKLDIKNLLELIIKKDNNNINNNKNKLDKFEKIQNYFQIIVNNKENESFGLNDKIEQNRFFILLQEKKQEKNKKWDSDFIEHKLKFIEKLRMNAKEKLEEKKKFEEKQKQCHDKLQNAWHRKKQFDNKMGKFFQYAITVEPPEIICKSSPKCDFCERFKENIIYERQQFFQIEVPVDKEESFLQCLDCFEFDLLLKEQDDIKKEIHDLYEVYKKQKNDIKLNIQDSIKNKEKEIEDLIQKIQEIKFNNNQQNNENLNYINNFEYNNIEGKLNNIKKEIQFLQYYQRYDRLYRQQQSNYLNFQMENIELRIPKELRQRMK